MTVHRLQTTQAEWQIGLASNDVVNVRYVGKETFRIEYPYLVDWYPGHTATIPRVAFEELETLAPDSWEEVGETTPATPAPPDEGGV